MDAVLADEGRALVVRGEPGVGKTVLLEYVAEHASGCRVAHASAVESEMELAYAGGHRPRRPVGCRRAKADLAYRVVSCGGLLVRLIGGSWSDRDRPGVGG